MSGALRAGRPERTVAGRFTLARVWTLAAVALPAIAALRSTIATNDLAYQIRAGELILRLHRIPHVDSFTLTAAGRPWVDQQWGAQVVFALAFRVGGWVGLALLRTLLVGATAGFVLLACRAAGARPKRAALLSLAGFAIWAGGAALRPQMLGMALFAAIVWLGFERRRHPRWLWATPLLTAAWANLHGSFFLAPLLLGLLWLQDRHDGHPDARHVLAVTAVSAAATLANPFAAGVWAYTVRISTNPTINRVITEWQPPTIRDSAGVLFFGSMIAVAALLAVLGRRTPWSSLLLFGLFALVGLEAVRGTFWWGIVVPPALVGLLPPSLPEDDGRPVLNGTIAVGLIAVAIVSLPRHGGTRSSPSPGLVANAPIPITDALRRELRPGEGFYAPVPWSSWFELALPDNPVFMDPRIEIFPRAVLDQHEDVSIGRQGWQEVLERWHIRIVACERTEEAQLIPIISRDPAWRVVHRDAAGLIAVRVDR